MHKKEIYELIKRGDVEEFKKIAEEASKMLDYLKEHDEKAYKKFELCIYEIVHGEEVSMDMAEEWVECMDPKRKWTKDETDSILKNRMIDCDPIEFYVVMNMIYSDYGHIIGDNLNTYVEFSKAFLHDKDAKPHKLFNYYKCIVDKED